MTTTDGTEPGAPETREPQPDALSALLTSSLQRKRASEGRLWSQTKLSRELRVTEQTVSRWFRGQTHPSDFNIERLRRLLDWTDAEYSSVTQLRNRLIRVSSVGLPDVWERLSLPREFPELHSLHRHVSRADLQDLTFPPDLPEFDPTFVVTKVAAFNLARAVTANSTRVVATSLGHGATTYSQMITDRRAAQTVPAQAIVFTHALSSLISADPDDLLRQATTHLADLHLSARDGRWNPDDAWVAARSQALAEDKFAVVTHDAAHQALNRAVMDATVRTLVSQPRVISDANCYARLLGFGSPPSKSDQEAARTLRRHRVKLVCAAFDVPLRVGDNYLTNLELDPASLRVCSASPISEWADIADLSPALVPAEPSSLVMQLRNLGVRLHGVIDLSPSPVGRLYVSGGGGELLTGGYCKALEIYTTELVALRQRLNCTIDFTLVVPKAALFLLPAEFSFEVDLDDGDAVRDQLEMPPYTTHDLVQMIVGRYLPDDDQPASRSGALAELACLVDLAESMAITTAAWLAKQRMTELPAMAKTDSLSWNQEDFDEAIRGLCQMIGLSVSRDPAGRRAAEMFLAGLQRELPQGEDARYE